jgi:hypothetical protein
MTRLKRFRRQRPCCTEAGPDGTWTQCPNPVCYLSDTDIVRASERQHSVQGGGSEGNFGRLGSVGARSQGVPDHTFVPPDRRFDLGSQIVAAGFCQAMRPRSAIICRWRSRCVGAVSADALATAPARGGTVTAASG